VTCSFLLEIFLASCPLRAHILMSTFSFALPACMRHERNRCPPFLASCPRNNYPWPSSPNPQSITSPHVPHILGIRDICAPSSSDSILIKKTPACRELNSITLFVFQNRVARCSAADRAERRSEVGFACCDSSLFAKVGFCEKGRGLFGEGKRCRRVPEVSS
jgi:hypothetical protein